MIARFNRWAAGKEIPIAIGSFVFFFLVGFWMIANEAAIEVWWHNLNTPKEMIVPDTTVKG